MSDTALSKPLRDLLDHWADVEARWRDSRAQAFHETYLQGLPESLNAIGNHITKLDTVLAQIRSACE